MSDPADSKETPGFFSRLKSGLTGAGEDLAAAEGFIADAELAPWQHVQLTEEQKVRLFERLTRGLQHTGSSIGQGLGNLILGRKSIDDDLLEEIETQLLMADIGIDATQQIIDNITGAVERKQLADPEALYKALQDELAALLAPAQSELVIDEAQKPYVILVVGVNGAGKTTTIGKLAKQFKDRGLSVMMAAGDTFRAAAIEQLQVWGERTGTPVIAKAQGSDAAALAFDAINEAKAAGADVLLIDTAGRLQNRAELMEELAKVIRVIRKQDETAPHDCVLVLDGTVGQNAHNQVKAFKEMVEVSGLVITKLDGSTRGGVVVALADQFELPVHAVGVGESAEDLQPFDADRFARDLMGLD